MSSVIPPFQRFLDDHRDEVWRLLVASVGPDQAEDCFQETFIAALRGYAALRPNSNLRAWVLTIANNKALDAHRSRGRRPLPIAATPDAESTPMNGIAPASAIERDESLWSAVRELPDRQRSAVVLRCLGELPHREIGAAIGCSEQAARRSLHEGLAKLREAISGD